MREVLVLIAIMPLGLLFVLNQRLDVFQPTPIGPVTGGVVIPIAGPAPVLGAGFVSDFERFALARAAGWNLQDAVTATAISMAEDGSGDPAALSALNRNNSRDLGLWQVNSAWWPQFGGQNALVNPLNNARAAFAIYQRQGWCAWSTYDERCGPGHIGSYRAYLARARIASGG